MHALSFGCWLASVFSTALKDSNHPSDDPWRVLTALARCVQPADPSAAVRLPLSRADLPSSGLITPSWPPFVYLIAQSHANTYKKNDPTFCSLTLSRTRSRPHRYAHRNAQTFLHTPCDFRHARRSSQVHLCTPYRGAFLSWLLITQVKIST